MVAGVLQFPIEEDFYYVVVVGGASADKVVPHPLPLMCPLMVQEALLVEILTLEHVLTKN